MRQVQPSMQRKRKGSAQSLTLMRLRDPDDRCVLRSSVLHRERHWQSWRNRHWHRRHYRRHDDILRLRWPPGRRAPILDTNRGLLRGPPGI